MASSVGSLVGFDTTFLPEGDVILRTLRSFGLRASARAIYPALVHHAIDHFKSPDVMRFLGQKLHGNFKGEVITSFKERPEGVRVKHWVRGNSVKMYDKARRVLRVETPIARTTDFKVLRPLRDDL